MDTVLIQGETLPERATARADRSLVAAILASRVAYCSYAVAVEALNLNDYARPSLSVAALLVALAVSGALGFVIWQRRQVSLTVAVADVAAGVLVVLILGFAQSPERRSGSLNWSLAYTVACSIWLAFGGDWRRRLPLTGALGLAYAVSVLAGEQQPQAALTVTTFVNAISPPVYFGIAVAVIHLVRRIAEQTDEVHRVEREQRRETASLAERERLFREVHRPVALALDSIADGQTPDAALRILARTEARALRHVLKESGGDGARSGLAARLAALGIGEAGRGRGVEVIDEELSREPGRLASDALRDAIAEILSSPVPTSAQGLTRVRLLTDDYGTELLVRFSTSIMAVNDPAIRRAQARLSAVAGSIEVSPSLPGEIRLVLKVPE